MFKIDSTGTGVFQVLILEPSKLFQPAIVSVNEEDQSRTVQLKHATRLKVCKLSGPPLFEPLSDWNTFDSLNKSYIRVYECISYFVINKFSVWVYSQLGE